MLFSVYVLFFAIRCSFAPEAVLPRRFLPFLLKNKNRIPPAALQKRPPQKIRPSATISCRIPAGTGLLYHNEHLFAIP